MQVACYSAIAILQDSIVLFQKKVRIAKYHEMLSYSTTSLFQIKSAKLAKCHYQQGSMEHKVNYLEVDIVIVLYSVRLKIIYVLLCSDMGGTVESSTLSTTKETDRWITYRDGFPWRVTAA